MQIAFILSQKRDEANDLLRVLAQDLLVQGYSLCGCVQSSCQGQDRRSCDMDLRLIPSEKFIRISQNLGREARGCRLDSAALEQAVALLEQDLKPSCDLLIINKFGKHEAEGRGFATLIASAIEQKIPVLLAVNALNHQDFLDFAGDYAQQLCADYSALKDWVLKQFEP